MSVFQDKSIPDFHDKMDLVKYIYKTNPNVFLVCFRDKNKNVLLCQVNTDQQGQIEEKNPVSVYWLILEPSYRDKRRKKGIMHDYEEMMMIERTLVYSYKVEWKNHHKVNFSFKQLPIPITVHKVQVDKPAQGFATHEGEKYYLKYIYIESSENLALLNLADNVKQIMVSGINVKTKQSHIFRVK